MLNTVAIHAATISDQISGWHDSLGPWLFYAVVWTLVFAGTGLFIGAFVPFITGDSLVFAAGLVAAAAADSGAWQDVNIWAMAAGVGVAAWLGDQVGYAIGLRVGRPYLEKRKGAWLVSAIAKSEKFYQAWGWWAVVIARFMPWARVFVPAIAGISKMSYAKFYRKLGWCDRLGNGPYRLRLFRLFDSGGEECVIWNCNLLHYRFTNRGCAHLAKEPQRC
jgi:membrane-associated protein